MVSFVVTDLIDAHVDFAIEVETYEELDFEDNFSLPPQDDREFFTENDIENNHEGGKIVPSTSRELHQTISARENTGRVKKHGVCLRRNLRKNYTDPYCSSPSQSNSQSSTLSSIGSPLHKKKEFCSLEYKRDAVMYYERLKENGKVKDKFKAVQHKFRRISSLRILKKWHEQLLQRNGDLVE